MTLVQRLSVLWEHMVMQMVEALCYKPELIPTCVMGNFHWRNPSSCMVALELTQDLTEMSTRNMYWGVKVASAEGWQLYHLHVPNVLKPGSLKLMEPSGPVQGWFYLLSMSYVLVERTTFCTSIIFVIKTTLFLDVTQYCLVGGFLTNVGVCLPNYVVSHPRILCCLAHFLPCHYSTTCENKTSSRFNP
jgi:hypothetical protein